MDEVAKRLEEVRLLRGWSAREFSRRAGVDEQQFAKVRERGGATATARVVAALAAAAGVSADWVIRGEGPGPDEALADDAPAYGNAPGWAEAEALYKKATPGLAAWVYREARRSRGYVPPGNVTPETVAKVVSHVLAMVPLEEQARRALAAVDAQAKRLNTRADNAAKRAAPPANDALPGIEPPQPAKRRRA